MKTRPALVSGGAVGIAAVTFVVACGNPTPCDSASYATCSGGVVREQGCIESRILVECPAGCIEEGRFGNPFCPEALCREPTPKMAGVRCQAAADCLPTPATVSSTEVTNTYLTCDTGTQTCVATDAPVVADWLQPCNPDLIIEQIVAAADGGTQAIDGVIVDARCAEGLCAVRRGPGASCIANACTRACTGDHECPRGSTCQAFNPASCGPLNGYCKPGGPDGIGFTCG